jgi:hypothetical protein
MAAWTRSERPERQSATGPSSSQWRTANAQNGERGGQDGAERVAAGHTLNLQDQVTLASWPTPTKQDQSSSGVKDYPPTETHHSGTTLTDWIWLTAGRGYIHPTFAEWMQGFPAGWTDCGASEMP